MGVPGNTLRACDATFTSTAGFPLEVLEDRFLKAVPSAVLSVG